MILCDTFVWNLHLPPETTSSVLTMNLYVYCNFQAQHRGVKFEDFEDPTIPRSCSNGKDEGECVLSGNYHLFLRLTDGDFWQIWQKTESEHLISSSRSSLPGSSWRSKTTSNESRVLARMASKHRPASPITILSVIHPVAGSSRDAESGTSVDPSELLRRRFSVCVHAWPREAQHSGESYSGAQAEPLDQDHQSCRRLLESLLPAAGFQTTSRSHLRQ